VDQPVFWLGELAAFFTALYMGRLIFLTFAGERPRGEGIHPHESPKVMTVPLIALAVFAVGLGWLGMPGDHNLMHDFLGSSAPQLGEAAHGAEHAAVAGGEFSIAGIHFAVVPLIVSILAAGLGWLAAGVIWGWKKVDVVALKRAFPPLAWAHTAIRNKYYFDEIYQATFVRGTVAAANAVGLFDRYAIDGLVNLVGWGTRVAVAGAIRLTDTWVVDGAVNLVAQAQKLAGRLTSILQTGRVQNYIAFSAVLAALIAAAAYVLGGGPWWPI
jgi:NADH-quinone oxidoreductase subunit L